MTSALHQLFRPLLTEWLRNGSAPDAPAEGITPECAAALAAQPSEFSFDMLWHTAETAGWGWQSIAFADIFDGSFYLYLPAAWRVGERAQSGAQYAEDGQTRLTIWLAPAAPWLSVAESLLERERVVAFDYEPKFRPNYHRWLFVTADDSGGLTAHGAYGSGSYLMLAQAALATDNPERTKDTLRALIMSNPWFGWIQAAKAQRDAAAGAAAD